MSQALFQFPQKAYYGRSVPKSKIYEHAKITNGLRQKFISQVDKIIWEYKLAPETINLQSQKSVPEIEIFLIMLKVSELDIEIVRCIDQAIPFPTFYKLIYENRIKVISAYKRPSEANSHKWVIDSYFETSWQQIDSDLISLPLALDLPSLYEQMMRHLIPLPPRAGESLKVQIERIEVIRRKQNELKKLEIRLHKEKQFNRKVELNTQLRVLKNELDSLTR